MQNFLCGNCNSSRTGRWMPNFVFAHRHSLWQDLRRTVLARYNSSSGPLPADGGCLSICIRASLAGLHRLGLPKYSMSSARDFAVDASRRFSREVSMHRMFHVKTLMLRTLRQKSQPLGIQLGCPRRYLGIQLPRAFASSSVVSAAWLLVREAHEKPWGLGVPVRSKSMSSGRDTRIPRSTTDRLMLDPAAC